ncbi:MAG: hypothetical protein A3J54_02640 [Candidatus Ryanbacteria bacterium RIFCSPHIGHO2_02_FULL_45_13b]|uniref:Uncharacterized protein n=1 Tax=Candidatus Ryanbacteria bacterium RIFCSPHIGHO2_02_FULL_45_13b TaxID=1802117 RepID=A0A1G2G7V0_9BACT|nr:MAG: hypothetical protein A3J54_02640 [Candidatus Ryanbacteria bacterium RIFCSPHIGHO2_02_FULL_45_13b]
MSLLEILSKQRGDSDQNNPVWYLVGLIVLVVISAFTGNLNSATTPVFLLAIVFFIFRRWYEKKYGYSLIFRVVSIFVLFAAFIWLVQLYSIATGLYRP